MQKQGETEVKRDFPDQCIGQIMSFTTPADVCRLSLINREFKKMGETDEAWEKFLPPQEEIDTILSQSTSASTSTSAAASGSKLPKKELYLALCDKSALINDGKMSLSLDKWTGKKCYMICARALRLVWAGEKNNEYWQWISVPESRFKEVACLEKVSWLEIRGRIDMRMMSPSTLYKAYLVYKLTADAYGFQLPVEVATRAREFGFEYKDLDHNGFIEYPNKQRGCLRPDRRIKGTLCPRERVDGWLELELGEYLCGEEDDEELEMACAEMKDQRWKKGLIVEGIELRPERKKYCGAEARAGLHSLDKGKSTRTTGNITKRQPKRKFPLVGSC